MEKSFPVHIRPFSETDLFIRRQLESGGPGFAAKDGFFFIRIGEAVYSCPDSPEGRALMDGILNKDNAVKNSCSETDVWNALLKGSADVMNLQQYGIREHLKRCVVLLRPMQNSSDKILRENIPLEENDQMIPIGNGDIALVLCMNRRTRDEVAEFAAAAAETLESEIGISCCIGVGRPYDSLDGIALSYNEAEAAIKTGIRHQTPGRVYAFDCQLLERLADLIPVESALKFQKDIFPERIKKILTDEMLETIRVFFRNDLNLSTTARQLFIHRNTLLYRMEKIRKTTGLDLRKFEDAAVFRFVMCFPEESD